MKAITAKPATSKEKNQKTKLKKPSNIVLGNQKRA
jgi:hypothetical protein